MIRLSGKSIEVPLQNVQVPVTVGNIVTFSFSFSYTSQSKREPSSSDRVSILHVRHDVDWFNNSYYIGIEKSMCFSFIFNLKTDFTKHKLFFENYAKDNGFDPLVPENWYFQTIKNILSITVCLYNNQHTCTYYTTIEGGGREEGRRRRRKHTTQNTTYLIDIIVALIDFIFSGR
jgi:hypothetical protein